MGLLSGANIDMGLHLRIASGENVDLPGRGSGRDRVTSVRILTEAERRRLVPRDLAVVDAVADGFRALAGGAVMPPILSMEIAAFNGEVDAKTAYVHGVASFAMQDTVIATLARERAEAAGVGADFGN